MKTTTALLLGDAGAVGLYFIYKRYAHPGDPTRASMDAHKAVALLGSVTSRSSMFGTTPAQALGMKPTVAAPAPDGIAGKSAAPFSIGPAVTTVTGPVVGRAALPASTPPPAVATTQMVQLDNGIQVPVQMYQAAVERQILQSGRY